MNTFESMKKKYNRGDITIHEIETAYIAMRAIMSRLELQIECYTTECALLKEEIKLIKDFLELIKKENKNESVN